MRLKTNKYGVSTQREGSTEKCYGFEARRGLLLFRHSAKILNAQEERLATSPRLATRLHLPHAVVVSLHLRKSNVVILTPETAGR